jgi:Predicted flavin-nucleotide-binding protein
MDDMLRRKDRQLSAQAANELLAQGKICHLALAAHDEPYLVTMNYGYRDTTLYFHCAGAGKKLELLRQNSRVCFTVVADTKLVASEKACDYTMKYRSVVGYGTARLVEGHEEKSRALDVIMAQYAPGEFEYSQPCLAATTVFVVDIESMTAKSNY